MEFLRRDKKYKLFFVEVDDEDRERVVEATVTGLEIQQDNDYGEVFSEYSIAPMARYLVSSDVTVTAHVVPAEDGTMFTIRDFTEEDEYDSE